MRIVLTNDDGFDAPGLAALHAAVRTIEGAQVRVIAPAVAYSGKGHVVSPQFRCHDTELRGIGRVTVVDGTPADCVRAAIALPGEPRPDWVVAGINHGSNLGIDVYYSGTVAAAREAAILGIPSIGISKLVRSESPTDWADVARLAGTVLAALIAPQQPAPASADVIIHARTLKASVEASSCPGFWNVNLPTPRDGRPPDDVRLSMLSTDPLQVRYEESLDENGLRCMTSRGNYHERPASNGTDVEITFGGSISLTRVPL